jgi:hypothetical protein
MCLQWYFKHIHPLLHSHFPDPSSLLFQSVFSGFHYSFFIYIYICIHIYVYIYTHTHICIYRCTHAYIHMQCTSILFTPQYHYLPLLLIPHRLSDCPSFTFRSRYYYHCHHFRSRFHKWVRIFNIWLFDLGLSHSLWSLVLSFSCKWHTFTYSMLSVCIHTYTCMYTCTYMCTHTYIEISYFSIQRLLGTSANSTVYYCEQI